MKLKPTATVALAIRIDPALAAWLDNQAAKTGKTKREIIESLLRNAQQRKEV